MLQPYEKTQVLTSSRGCSKLRCSAQYFAKKLASMRIFVVKPLAMWCDSRGEKRKTKKGGWSVFFKIFRAYRPILLTQNRGLIQVYLCTSSCHKSPTHAPVASCQPSSKLSCSPVQQRRTSPARPALSLTSLKIFLQSSASGEFH